MKAGAHDFVMKKQDLDLLFKENLEMPKLAANEGKRKKD